MIGLYKETMCNIFIHLSWYSNDVFILWYWNSTLKSYDSFSLYSSTTSVCHFCVRQSSFPFSKKTVAVATNLSKLKFLYYGHCCRILRTIYPFSGYLLYVWVLSMFECSISHWVLREEKVEKTSWNLDPALFNVSCFWQNKILQDNNKHKYDLQKKFNSIYGTDLNHVDLVILMGKEVICLL